MSPPPGDPALQAVDRVARQSYGRLVAWLAYEWRDLALAEDALSEALTKALALWPGQGVPRSPEAWLLTVARRELLQVARRERLHQSPQVQAVLTGDEAAAEAEAVPDRRLALMLVCAHPAIDPGVHTALMLQTVLGLEAREVAQAMLTSPAAMAQRLVRAKQKIRDSGLRFEEPAAEALPERLHAVLETIYAAYGLGWDALDGGDAAVVGLRSEALFLGELVCRLVPDSAEALGLIAMMLFCEARTRARHSTEGEFVPLALQDTRLWDRGLIGQAERCLWRAAALSAPGPFQIEAAIQSAHCQRLFSGDTPWAAVASLYEQLRQMAPTLGSHVGHLVALAKAGDLAQARALLAEADGTRLMHYQPYWVARFHIEQQEGRAAEARRSLEQAIGLTVAPSVRRFLLGELGRLSAD